MYKPDLTRSEFRDQVFNCLMEAVENGENQRAADIEAYCDYFFEDNDVTVRKAEFALRLRDELNKRMNYAQ